MKKVAALLVLALASVALIACGGGGESSSSTSSSTSEESATQGAAQTGGKAKGGEAIEFEADPGGQLAYTTDSATAKAGEVTIDFNNPQALTHDVAIENSKGETIAQTELIAEGEDSTTANLKPGTYTFYCTLPGHREAGMEGTLTVK
ncbi:MAG TPA: plastocyanin/azurin family copper-binding protein [Solirubrobacterales bacterium]|nr:plastocyanin/azurin family copper-binding protein [Solirubrobacterales bacterium]